MPQEMKRYISLIKHLCKDSYGYFIVYDISNKESFENVDKWFNLIKENAPQNSDII